MKEQQFGLWEINDEDGIYYEGCGIVDIGRMLFFGTNEKEELINIIINLKNMREWKIVNELSGEYLWGEEQYEEI